MPPGSNGSTGRSRNLTSEFSASATVSAFGSAPISPPPDDLVVSDGEVPSSNEDTNDVLVSESEYYAATSARDEQNNENDPDPDPESAWDTLESGNVATSPAMDAQVEDTQAQHVHEHVREAMHHSDDAGAEDRPEAADLQYSYTKPETSYQQDVVEEPTHHQQQQLEAVELAHGNRNHDHDEVTDEMAPPPLPVRVPTSHFENGDQHSVSVARPPPPARPLPLVEDHSAEGNDNDDIDLNFESAPTDVPTENLASVGKAAPVSDDHTVAAGTDTVQDASFDATMGPPSQRILDVWSAFFRNVVRNNPLDHHAAGTALQRQVFGIILSKEYDKLEQLLAEQPAAARAVDEDQMTPFHVAVCSGARDAIALLADFDDYCINFQDSNGDTALMVAIHEDQRSCLTCLLECGAEVNVQSKNKNTALHLVAAAVGGPCFDCRRKGWCGTRLCACVRVRVCVWYLVHVSVCFQPGRHCTCDAAVGLRCRQVHR